jgi:hypothetical protein
LIAGIVGLALVGGGGTVWAGDCKPAIDTRVTGAQPSPEQLGACLLEKPRAIFSIGGGLELDSAGDQLFGAFVTADVPMLSPLWLSARFRYQPASKVDLLVGYRLGGSYGMGYDSWISSDTGTTTTVTSNLTALRSDWVLVGGLKGVITGDGIDVGKTYQVGLQWHEASGFGGHKRIEGYVVARGTSLGATIAYYNAIPPTKGLVFGMEAGYVPVSIEDDAGMNTLDGDIYWAMVDLGWSWEM